MNLAERSDEELLLLCQQGSRAAFAQLYDRYWLNLIKKALHKLERQEDAEEVVQTLFINLWRRRDNIQLRASFRTYLYTALRYEILQFIDTWIKRSAYVELDDAAVGLLPLDETDMGRMEVKELESNINEIINGLPEKCRLIFKMSRDEGMSAKQIAHELDISHRTVETQISKAVGIIKKTIQRFNILFFL
ncbi:RNA polymerase sigma-70 factor [Sphingobacterium oryzagri]|uniref:RNA polymerase sigma-70 factor n=1 Tax=Sphingobacterium oryzagri TaxID=3025669 RepID=A0ABY7WL30_9SPHI|nr:RNA polymerase sigma-70 factor [Sphingobacterium sp. KACC 22765]WDF70306.1 RNA polymerase sigma-70 factor [Sphingobacterium sp. KACC 22765]